MRALPPPEVPTDSPEDPAVAAASDRFLGGLSEGGGRLPLDGPALNPRYAFGEDCGEKRQDETRQDSLDPEREGGRERTRGKDKGRCKDTDLLVVLLDVYFVVVDGVVAST